MAGVVPFTAVVGHGRQLDVLGQSILHGAVAPSYLFYGPAGVGKMRAALEFARALLCRDDPAGACGRCGSCRHIEGGAHPDLIVIAPETKKLKIEQVRALQEFLSLKPAYGDRRVCLLDSADTMSIEAANAMLKTLEEPPPGVVLILVSSHPGRLPVTIPSRCRRISFGPLEEDQVREVLVREGWSRDEAEEAARAAGGSPGDVHALRGEAWTRARKNAALLKDAAVLEGGEGVFGAVEGFSGKREDAELVLRLLLARVRLEIRSRVGVAGEAAPEEDPSLSSLSEEALAGLAGNLLETGRMLDGNVNVKLALGALCRSWAEGFAAGEVQSLQREW